MHSAPIIKAEINMAGMKRLSLDMERGESPGGALHRVPSEFYAVSGKHIVFKDLGYTIPQKEGSPKIILNGLNGAFESGAMTALMGPSGSGKTTLLDVLSGRKTIGTMSGSFTVGGVKPTSHTFRHEMGYVEQFDTLVGTLTVGDMLMYTAELKRPQTEPISAKQEKVDKIINELGLSKVRDQKIGDNMTRGISGGQGKRLNIGCGLVTEPAVLFLDEPTTGLDSATADDVMVVVKSLARHGRTVVCTIHSPSSQSFRLFDTMYLLYEGACVFNGNPHSEAIPHFENCGFLFQVGDSVADYCVFITGGGTKGNMSGFDFVAAYNDSRLATNAEKKILQLEQGAGKAVADTAPQPSFRPLKVLHEVGVLLKYRGVSNYKDGEYLGQRLGDKIMLALVMMSLFWKEADETNANGVMSIGQVIAAHPMRFLVVTSSEGEHQEHYLLPLGHLKFLLMMCILPAYGAAIYVPSLVLERPLFFREYNDGCYHVVSYLLAKLIEEAVIAVFFGLFFTAVCFFGVGLNGSYLVLFMTYYLSLQCGITLAFAVASVAPTMEAANAILPAYVTVGLFFIGAFITYGAMPDGWRWYSSLVHMRYAWTALMVNEFDNSTKEGALNFLNGRSILNYYELDDKGSSWDNIGILTIFYVIFGLFAYAGQCSISFVKR